VFQPLEISFLVRGLAFAGDSLTQSSLGGSETAGLCLARELAALGHHVTMFSNCPRPGIYDRVLYRELGAFVDYARSAPHDVTVVQRMPEIFSARYNSRLNILWCHDLALGRQAELVRSALWNIDKIAVVSEFMADQYRQVYQLTGGNVVWATRNGIDLHRFPRPLARDRQTLVFGARPERGLDTLLEQIFPRLLARDPSLTLHLATYAIAVPELRDYYARCEAAIDRLGPRCVHHPPMPKAQYYELLASAGCYVYPTPSRSAPAFAETSCISVLECQAAGLPVVTSRRGGLPETLGPGAGTLIDGEPWSEAYQEAFIEAVLGYVHDDGRFSSASSAGLTWARSLGWDGVARQWSDALTRFIEARNDSPSRLVRHFIRRSDIIAAKTVVSAMPEHAERAALTERLDAWRFAESVDGIREQYNQIGLTHKDVFDQVPQETRFKLLEAWLMAHPDAQRILDFGCAHGGYAVGLANRVGRDWVGVDIDQHSVAWAERNRATHLTHPEAHLTFRVGGADLDLSDEAPFDTLVAFEVLEHVPDPATMINQLERWVRPDGVVLITVPYGPWEWMSYRTYPHRAHLWDFDLHDLRELFGKKKQVAFSAITVGEVRELGEPVGWHLIEYQVDGTPTEPIDLARKVRLQRPRDTVSLVMIAGPGAERTLGWALEPVHTIVDELIIGDCGMSDEARAIATAHDAVIVPAVDPTTEGFDVARNLALDHARMDWVLWHDTDERLIGAPNLLKYLRGGYFTGYAITQHNFKVDDRPKETVTPVRCFRRIVNGTPMRFFGMCHEHPELALNEGVGPWVILRDVHLAHVGYLEPATQIDKFNRNIDLLRRDLERYPDRLLQKHFLCRELMTLAAHELKATGGIVSAEIEQKCREVIRLYREYFLGKPVFLNTDTMQYYSAALGILNEGVEVKWAWGVAKAEAELGRTQTCRFADYAEAETELTWRLRDAVTPQLSPWW
jgi:glycosyltransferase involved in cell wall biosynthesis/2-polyprenyl-3-methyl-5-hydroxy-6-metoxy-1,4-benzoquinol methylase